jgi:hypothetical protein
VPADYGAIGDAITAASSGDTILVGPGTYSGPSNREMRFGGKDIVLVAEGGPAVTIIDCQDQANAFRILDGETRATVIQGFTIYDGAASVGGGIYVGAPSSPSIRECVFVSCRAYGTSSPPFHPAFGGAIGYGGVGPVGVSIIGCTFIRNRVDGSPAIGGALDIPGVAAPESSIERCLFVENNGGTIRCGSAYVEYPVIHNIGDFYINWYPDENMWETSAGLCAGADPFSSEPCSDSVCLPDRNPWGVLVGPLEAGCGPCGSVVRESSWGAIKALYR